ncbi:GNAT family N-acetyltransferase [Streptococcus merionis]|uniref:Acetyltransferase, GNAT family n=1 Tax=Streptococcus merionis TaxID=400065 RepID=A0A239SXW2_9STRE|nr:GNAT family N-acetyltransferase [Streptococcus merionis]SNU90287.1 acetyltransferase, GNAT family [Streptococcus merionis]
MQIRTIIEKDYEQVLALQNHIWTPYNSPVFDQKWTVDDILKRRGSRADILIAVENDLVLGMLSYNPMYPFEQGDHVVTFGLAVHPNAQGKGVGKALLLAFFELAHSLDFLKISMHVTAGNSSAIALYEKMGFQLEAKLEGNLRINGVFHDNLMYGKWLEGQDA